MDIEEMRNYCLSKPYSFETLPFGDAHLVFKVGFEDQPKAQKMFALLSFDEPYMISLKCDPERAITLREHHSEIQGAYHFNKKHWNELHTDGNLPRALILELIDHSYELVKKSLPCLRK